MDDPVRVQILQSKDNLLSIALHLELVQSFPSLEQFIHTLILAQLEQDVDILCVFKEMLKETNMRMLDSSMNLDLTHQLLFCSALGQTGLLNDLGCMDELGLSVDEFVAFGEASLAKVLALDVSFDAYFTIGLFEFLLDDCLRLDS